MIPLHLGRVGVQRTPAMERAPCDLSDMLCVLTEYHNIICAHKSVTIPQNRTRS